MGVQASPNDRVPEYHAETLPAGTAPKSRTFQPNPSPEDSGIPVPNPDRSFPGATSADVHTGLGHPGQGETSTELRHDGSHGRKKQGSGLAGLASGVGNQLPSEDPKHVGSRSLDSDHEPGIRR